MTEPGGSSTTEPTIGRGLVLLLAVTCGVLVANLYYAQPLLDTIARSFDIEEGTAGILVTTAQIGYAIGLAFLVPLGDLIERRRLIVTAALICAVADGIAVVSPGFPMLAAALVLAGVGASAAMVIVPLASALAAEEDRGRTVGTVMSGLLTGILLARTVSGFLSELGGWRLVYGVAAMAIALLAVVLRKYVPVSTPVVTDTYRGILGSILTLVRELRELRLRMALGALLMAAFSVLWTGLAFLLAAPPFSYGDAVIGLFGIAGVAGALMAPIAGRMTDKGHGRRATTLCLTILLASWALLFLGSGSSAVWAVVVLIVGIMALDLGTQGAHISNQNVVFVLDPPARNRLNTAYMVSYFGGGVLGSVAASVSYSVGGWAVLCLTGAAISLAALAIWLLGRSASSGSVVRSDHVHG
ncbi:MFS transporter [Rhodococcus sp. BP-149]|uniref:MFS transporter n=1 Tax=unclassified Rhodococcus (in: high G+C Gram-positive bacteria) TaxID=192944 RepID=UPI001C9A8B2D|nr:MULTISPECIES: MFS transporter [unclassified Rhodococcus (in: high G+C Gram-positive bacteria)]MBY6683944.1 MFS transporter [Rhodococcus sp. BP-288]MBY6693395.1 MFS transporter [Rhodococcus sp. BP-188]MBY6697592.1 MFS transporter [Rhodococcus sp. BP-285]MBY6702269.1 MFS transporter [Rhodococcus sp. BP-283]MBY6709798.1 MFS transporter [Rhodococcus sp. BP-160]